jgi:hypothetical protein
LGKTEKGQKEGICNNVKFLLEFLKRNKKLSTQHVFLNKERDITLQFNQVKTTKFVTSINVNGGTDTKPMGQTEPQFLSDPMSDRKKKFLPTLLSLSQRWPLNTSLTVVNSCYIYCCSIGLIKYKFEQNLFYLH